MAGGIPISYKMHLKPGARSSADYTIDFDELEKLCNKNTKVAGFILVTILLQMLVLNNPNNPVGKLYTRKELEAIAELAKKYDLIIIADEVYEWHQMGKEMIRFGKFLWRIV